MKEITPDELMQGNLITGVYFTEGCEDDETPVKEIVRFLGYDPFGKTIWVEGGKEIDYEYFEPIPITEDWLIKLGFTYSEGLRMYRIDECFETCEPDDYEDSVYHHVYFYHNGDCFGFEVSNEWGENGNLMMSKIKYIHQLQNLYRALTQQPLTIKK